MDKKAVFILKNVLLKNVLLPRYSFQGQTLFFSHFLLNYIWTRNASLINYSLKSIIFIILLKCFWFINVYLPMYALFWKLWVLTLNENVWVLPKYYQNVFVFDLQKTGSFSKCQWHSKKQMKLLLCTGMTQLVKSY